MTSDVTIAPDPPSRAVALGFDQVSMVFPDGTEAIERVDLRIEAGEFVTIVGPSGCGKSTLLRIAAGLEANTGGACTVDRESLGYVFQDPTLFPWRSVRRNVALFAELHGIDRAAADERVDDVLQLVGLTDYADKHPRQLSGGMRMRASVARALVLQPDTFLFDEPFGALDEITREHLNDELLALFRSKRFAALFITHSITEAVYLSTRVLVMSARPGRIVAEHVVPFDYPRRPELRYDAAFNQLAGEISLDLRAAHR